MHMQAGWMNISQSDSQVVHAGDCCGELSEDTERIENAHFSLAELLPSANVVRRVSFKDQSLDLIKDRRLCCESHDVGVTELRELLNHSLDRGLLVRQLSQVNHCEQVEFVADGVPLDGYFTVHARRIKDVRQAAQNHGVIEVVSRANLHFLHDLFVVEVRVMLLGELSFPENDLGSLGLTLSQ